MDVEGGANLPEISEVSEERRTEIQEQNPNLHPVPSSSIGISSNSLYPEQMVINHFRPPHNHQQFAICLLLLSIYLVMGTIGYWLFRDRFQNQVNSKCPFLDLNCPAIDAFYFSIITLSTLGFGDIVPKDDETWIKIFVSILIIFAMVIVNGVIDFLIDLVWDFFSENLFIGRKVTKWWQTASMTRKYATLGVILMSGLLIGIVFLHYSEKFNWWDSLYLSLVIVSSVGYGDHALITRAARIFGSVFILLFIVGFARCLAFLVSHLLLGQNKEVEDRKLIHDTFQKYALQKLIHERTVTHEQIGALEEDYMTILKSLDIPIDQGIYRRVAILLVDH